MTTTYNKEHLLIIKNFLTVNRYSRPGKKRKGVKAIEIHWVENPDTSAEFNRNYFQMRKGGGLGFGSTHFIIDLNGDIMQMIPEDEIAYSSGAKEYRPGIVEKFGSPPYYNTISIECTHRNWAGKMNPETYGSLILLAVYLCRKNGLRASDLILHYEITGKVCHKWFVGFPTEWARFKDHVELALNGAGQFEIEYVEKADV